MALNNGSISIQKTTKGKAVPTKAQKNLKEQAVRQALDLAAAQGWDKTTLADIAKACDVTLADLHEHFDDKTDILVAFGRMIDRKVLENMGTPDDSVSPRDRLFDILMERFEALHEYRPGLVAVLESFVFDPKQALISLPHLCRSMTWMLEAAGMDTGGMRGALKVAGLSGVYLKVLKTWKDNESEDLAKTMAALDRDLGRAEQIANSLGF